MSNETIRDQNGCVDGERSTRWNREKKVSGEETNIIPSSCRNQPGVMMMSMYAQQLLACILD
jgi:hypothetical protein